MAEVEVELAGRRVAVKREVLEEPNCGLGLVVENFDEELVRVVVSASLSRDLQGGSFRPLASWLSKDILSLLVTHLSNEGISQLP